MNDNEALSPITDAVSRGPEQQAPGAGPDVHDELLASLGRRFRGATLRLGFELRTAIARQIFHRDFVYVSQQLHALEASRRVQGLDRQVLRDALATVARRGDATRTQLLLCASNARALIAAHGHAQADVEFERPAQLQATIVSPHARDFLDLLGQADDALTQVEKAWLLGLLEPTERARQASDCRRVLHGFKETVRQQRHVVGLHVREVNAARRRFAANDPANDGNPGCDLRPPGHLAAAIERRCEPPPRHGPGVLIDRAPAAGAAEAMAPSDARMLDAASNEPVAEPFGRAYAAALNDGSSHT